jgi:predicted PurR-regulated permease PerM
MAIEARPASGTEAQQRSAAAWRALAGRLRTITPSGFGRIALVTATILGIAWLVGFTWPAIVPFLVGGVVAYAVLPLVDRLDRIMPRLLAGLLSVALVVGLAAGFIAIVAPPLVGQLVRIFLELPSADRLADAGRRVQDWLATLPEGSRALATEIVDRVVTILRGDLNGIMDGLAALIANSVVHLFDALSLVLGLLVIPTWILAVTRDGRQASQNLQRHIAPAIRADVVAIARIVDAAASSFLRVQLVAALGTGVVVWFGMQMAARAGIIPAAPFVAVAAVAGAAQLIPQVGVVIGGLPALLALATQPPEVALVFLTLYAASVYVVGRFAGKGLGHQALAVHPAIFIPAVVVASQIGIIALLVSGPLIAITVNVLRYAYGRLSEPARPAGLMPWEPLPPAPAAPGTATGRRTPLIYRRAAEARSAPAPVAPLSAPAALLPPTQEVIAGG